MSSIFEMDPARCVACGACVVACMDQNDIFPDEGGMPFRSSFSVEKGEGAEARSEYLSLSCMHCENAPCIAACPAGCLSKEEETGFTVYDNTNCIGCHSCAMACPFAAPCFNSEGKMVKCDGCITRVKNGLKPACMKVCPFDAIKLTDKEERVNNARMQAAKVVSSKLFGFQ